MIKWFKDNFIGLGLLAVISAMMIYGIWIHLYLMKLIDKSSDILLLTTELMECRIESREREMDDIRLMHSMSRETPRELSEVETVYNGLGEPYMQVECFVSFDTTSSYDYPVAFMSYEQYEKHWCDLITIHGLDGIVFIPEPSMDIAMDDEIELYVSKLWASRVKGIGGREIINYYRTEELQ